MKYVVKKFGTLIITLFAVSLLAFLAFQIIPGDAATHILGTEATPERLEALREQMGLNRPFLVQYFDWLKDFLFGDMGTSYSYHMSVKEMIGAKLPITGALSLMSFLMIVIVSIPLGMWQGIARCGSRCAGPDHHELPALLSGHDFYAGVRPVVESVHTGTVHQLYREFFRIPGLSVFPRPCHCAS